MGVESHIQETLDGRTRGDGLYTPAVILFTTTNWSMTVKQRLATYHRKKRHRDTHKQEIAASKRKWRQDNARAIAAYARDYNSVKMPYRMPDGTTRLISQSQLYKLNNRERVKRVQDDYYQRITKNRRAIYRQLLKLAGLN